MATFTTIKNRGGGRGALAGVLQYIRQDEKTLWEGHRLVSGWNCTAPTAWQEIQLTKERLLKQMAGSTTTSSNSLRQRMA